MAKHRRKWRPSLKKSTHRKPSQHSNGAHRPIRSNVPEAISTAVREVERATGHQASKVVELQRTDDGGWSIVAEAESSVGVQAGSAEQYVIRLSRDGRILSYELAGRESGSSAAESPQQAIPVDLGLRAELDTDIGISFRRINVVNLRLRGSIQPLRNKRRWS